jgi:hypothetical protein
MTRPLINASAGVLDTDEYEHCESLAYRLVLSCIVGNFLGDCSEFGDPCDIWRRVGEEIRSADEIAAVLEILASTLSHAMKEKDGAQSAAQDMKKKIAELDPTLSW